MDLHQPKHAGPVSADQAVFTSIRTPTGEGYRIIAASPGVRPDERAEITRRAPSHDSLSSPDEAAVGLIAFRMPAGRYCVGYCQCAGQEHTARGGFRVHTTFAVLAPEAFAAFGNDPTCVHAAIGRQVHGQPVLKQLPAIDPLPLDPQARPGPHAAPRDETAAALALASAALSGESLLVCGFDGGPASLAALYAAMPRSARPAVSLALGIKFSPTRQTQLNLTTQPAQDADRLLRGLRMTCMNWASPSTGDAGIWSPWIEFVQRRASWGRVADVAALTASMNEAMPAESLRRVAALCDDLEAILIADLPRLEKLVVKYRNHRPASATEAGLLQRFEKAARVRQEALRPAAATL